MYGTVYDKFTLNPVNCKKLFQFLNDDFFSANYNRKELKQFAITEPKKVLRSTSKFSINPFINSFKE